MVRVARLGCRSGLGRESRADAALGCRHVTSPLESGIRISDRYRLENQVASGDGWARWRATDETLLQLVGVLTFHNDDLVANDVLVAEVVRVARAVSGVSDRRLARILEVNDHPVHGFVVTEWLAGDTLSDLALNGPLEPAHAALLIAEAAEALSAAHDAGLAHLCLTPGSLRWTPGSGIRVAGVGIDAVLSQVASSSPALDDTRGLGRLLYAALTTHWPGPDSPYLPSAPLSSDGLPVRPRGMRAGVPASLDKVTWQAMFQQNQGGRRRNSLSLTTPAQLAAALRPVAGPATGRHRTFKG